MGHHNFSSPRGRSYLVHLLIILLITGPVLISVNRIAAQDFSIQTVQVIDLSATAANVQVFGAADNQHLGGNGTPNTFGTFPQARALAIGDINNDGFKDLIVGAPDGDFTPQGGAARTKAGAVYVVFGRQTFPNPTIIDTNTTALTQPDLKIFGAASNDNLGFAVATGDVNGDGIDDLIMGAPGVDVTVPDQPTRTDAGTVYVLFGASNLPATTLDLATPNVAKDQLLGEAAGDLFGSAIAVGDVNGGTSAPDLLVGAPGSKGPLAARTNGGAAYLLTGGAGLANTDPATKVIDLATGAALVRVFGKTNSMLGSAVAIGDVNGGTAGDLLLGAPKANRPDPGAEVNETGAVFVVFGGTNLDPVAPATSKTFDINTTQQNVSIYGPTSGDHLGASVATGNVDNDGAVDIITGAPEAGGPGNVRPFAGEAYVILGGTALNPPIGSTERRIDVSLNTVALTVIGAAAGDRLGASVAAGVVNTQGNTDTIPDILIGAPGAQANKGTVYVLFGGSGLLRFPGRDLLLGQDDVRITGGAAGDEFGWAIAIGDLDNNHGGDIAASAPFAEVQVVQGVTRTDAGKVYALLASAAVTPPQNQNPTVTVTAPNGGETALGGATFSITWTASDPDGDNTIQSFEIRLSTDSGATFNTTIASNVVGTARSILWNVPSGLNTTTARIRVTVFDNAGGSAQDPSNADFAISDAGVFVAVTAPNGGETLRWDQVFKITWLVGAGFEDQVRGFDLFYTTDNGVTFTSITPVNPTQPALAGDVREFNWTVPHLCTSTVKIVVRATSLTGATSRDFSNANFSIFEPSPNIDPTSITFSAPKQLNFHIVANSTPLFQDGAQVEISTDEAGTTFVPSGGTKVKNGGTKLVVKSKFNGQKVGDFFPVGASRVIRITNGTCGVVILHVHRVGDQLVVDAPAGIAPLRWQ